MAPLAGVMPLKFDDENNADLHLLTPEERDLCKTLRIQPKPYVMIKEAILREALEHGGSLKKKHVREICKIDSAKGGKIFDFFVNSGWLAKA